MTTPNTQLDDEMPQAPLAVAASVGSPEVAFSGDLSTDSYSKVPEMGEPLPVGTYHFRLDHYTVGWSDTPTADKDPFAFGAQPYMMLFWACQQEPCVGRSFVDFAPWVNDKTAAAANQTANPATASEAQKIVNDRIWKLKAIATAAGYKPPQGGGFNAKSFLATNPEIKIALRQKERKEKVGDKYVGTGKQGNVANEYLPMFGQRA